MRYNDEFRLYREIVKYSNYIRRYVLGTITHVGQYLAHNKHQMMICSMNAFGI